MRLYLKLSLILLLGLFCVIPGSSATGVDWYKGSWVLDVDASVEYASKFSKRSIETLRDAYSENRNRFKVKIDDDMLELAYRMNFFIRRDIDVKLDKVSADSEVAVFNGKIIRGYDKKEKTLYFYRMTGDHMRIEDVEGEIPIIVWSRK